MESHDQDQQRHQGSDSPRGDERPPDEGQSQPGRPAADSTEARRDPGQTTVVGTTDIRRADTVSAPQVLAVEVAPTSPRRPGTAGQEGASAPREKKGSSGDQDDGHDQPKARQGGKPAQAEKGPSTMRLLLYAGAVSLVCGIVGAWGYSYLFGKSGSDDKKTASKGSDSGKGSDSKSSSSGDEGDDKPKDKSKGSSQAEKGRSRDDMLQAQTAWLTAVKELKQARSAEESARHAGQEARAVLDFLQRTLLSGGRSWDAPLSDAFWAGGQRKDVSLKKALDGSEPQVSGAFADRPLGEASVREILGRAYLNVGEPTRAVEQYERALALREAVQGANQPETADCRNELAVAYRLANRPAEAGRLFDRDLNSPADAKAMALRGAMLLREKKPADAELKFRQGLTILQKVDPDGWGTFDAKSALGEALLDQEKYADAEPLLVSGYEGMTLREDQIPPRDRPHLTRALERLVRLYDAWGKEDEAAKWRKRLATRTNQAGGAISARQE